MFVDKVKRICSLYSVAKYGGGKSGPAVETVAATPTPAPAAAEATMEEFEDEELTKEKTAAKTQGAKSLQIPLGTLASVAPSATVGTV